jgi:hypothetical protein
VQAFDGVTNTLVKSFFAYIPSFTGGVRTATTDANGDGLMDIITSPGAGGGPHIRIFNGATNGAILSEFFAYTAQLTSGVFVAGNAGALGLQAAGTPSGGPAAAITDAELQSVLDTAIARWAAADISAQQLNRLRNTHLRLADLPDGYLGLTRSEAIYIDADAAGFGWYVDATPGNDDEFIAPTSDVASRMDLLTAVMHELGHAAGLADLDDDHLGDELMAETLIPGVRRVPSVGDIDDVFGQHDEWLY